MKELVSHDLFGLKINIFNRDELISYLVYHIKNRSKKICFGYSLGYIPLFKKIPGLYEKCNSYDLMVTDGRYFYWFARLFGAPIKYDISIPFLSELIMELANEKGFSIMLLGSTDDTNQKATENLRARFPNAIIYDGHPGGQFSAEDELESVAKIAGKNPDILFIGASTPLKEDFAYKWKDKLDVGLIVPFGGMIDGLAGKVKLTPPLLKKMGLASFVRIAQEPKRLFAKNMWQFYEFFFKLLPLTIYFRFVLRKKNFNLVREYLRK